jgi:hypothetical protein
LQPEEIAKYTSSEVPPLKQLLEEVKWLDHHQERRRTLNKLLSSEESGKSAAESSSEDKLPSDITKQRQFPEEQS